MLAVEVYQVICWVLYDFFLAEYLKELQNVESSTKSNNQLQEDIGVFNSKFVYLKFFTLVLLIDEYL